MDTPEQHVAPTSPRRPRRQMPAFVRPLQRVVRGLRTDGWRHTLRLVAENAARLAGPDAPRRLRQRHLRRDAARFDRRHGTDTAGFIQWTDAERGVYEATDEESFTQILDELALPEEKFTFLDIGCGKGKSTLLAARRPFREVVGVEFVGGLCDIARNNLARWPSRAQSVRIVHADAGQYDPPTGPLLVYLFNPFGPETLRRFLTRLQPAHGTAPRPLVIAYYHAVYPQIMDEAAWLAPLAAERLLLHGGFRAWANSRFWDEHRRSRSPVGRFTEAS